MQGLSSRRHLCQRLLVGRELRGFMRQPMSNPAYPENEEFLVDKAYSVLRNAIVCNDLKPGSPLSEGSLSERLGISRTPIREALKRLQDESLVRIVPRRGAFVSDISAEDIVQIYQLREAVECYAIQFVPQYGDLAELDELVAEVKRLPEWIKAGEIERVNDLDIRLHHYIARSSRNQLLYKLVNQLLNQVIRLRNMTPTVPGRLEQQADEHRQIVSALKAGDVEVAREALRNHLQKVRDTAVQLRLRMR